MSVVFRSVVFQDVRCPQCSGRAVEFFESPSGLWSQLCGACGYSRDKDGTQREGYGAYACSGKDGGIVQSGGLGEPADHPPFSPEELANMGFAWYSRRNEEGAWEGVLLKGTAKKWWLEGVLPTFEESDMEVDMDEHDAPSPGHGPGQDFGDL